jgi:hypothetical protein
VPFCLPYAHHNRSFKVRFVEAGYAREDVDKSLYASSPGINAGSPNVTNAGARPPCKAYLALTHF